MLDTAFAGVGSMDGKANKLRANAGCEAVKEIRNSETEMNIVDDVPAEDPDNVLKQLHGDCDLFFFVAKGKCLHWIMVSEGGPQ